MSDSATEFIPQMRPLFGAPEKAELAAYLDEDGFFTEFERTAAFERAIAAFTGSRHCIVVNNGTVSLTLAALAVGVGPGDEVICPKIQRWAAASWRCGAASLRVPPERLGIVKYV